MKIRQGFVSNSSSSSFVIAIPKGTEPTFDNLHRELYGTDDNKSFGMEYDWHHCDVNTYNVVEAIVSQISEGRYDYDLQQHIYGPVSDLSKAISLDWRESEKIYEQCQNREPHSNESGTIHSSTTDWDLHDKLYKEACERAAAKIKEKFPDHDFYEVEFSDDNQFGCEVEHGPALRGLPNVLRYSHH